MSSSPRAGISEIIADAAPEEGALLIAMGQRMPRIAAAGAAGSPFRGLTWTYGRVSLRGLVVIGKGERDAHAR